MLGKISCFHLSSIYMFQPEERVLCLISSTYTCTPLTVAMVEGKRGEVKGEGTRLVSTTSLSAVVACFQLSQGKSAAHPKRLDHYYKIMKELGSRKLCSVSEPCYRKAPAKRSQSPKTRMSRTSSKSHGRRNIDIDKYRTEGCSPFEARQSPRGLSCAQPGSLGK